MFGSAFLKPKIVLESWDVRPGEKIADFGCGAGFFSVALAQCAGPQGTVYALDVRQEALDAARRSNNGTADKSGFGAAKWQRNQRRER